MQLVNELADDVAAPGSRIAAETALSLLQPWAPHVTEELWERLGNARLWEQPWPVADPALLERETFELVIHGRQGDPADDRRPGQAREPGRRLGLQGPTQ